MQGRQDSAYLGRRRDLKAGQLLTAGDALRQEEGEHYNPREHCSLIPHHDLQLGIFDVPVRSRRG